MNRSITRLMLLLAVISSAISLSACEREEGPAEDMGEEIDQLDEQNRAY